MLQPNPEKPISFPLIVKPSVDNDAVPEPTPEAIKHAHDYANLRRRTGNVALTSLVIMSGLGYAYWNDVRQNIEEVANLKPSVEVIAQPSNPDNLDSATFILNGFNSVDADHYTQTNIEALQQINDGILVSMHYNNVPLANGQALYAPMVEFIEKHDISRIKLGSYSMGDIPAIKLMLKFLQEANIPVEVIEINSGPAGYETLRDYRQWELDFAKLLASVIAGSTDSTFWRIVAELYFYRDSYVKDGVLDPIKLIEVGIDIKTRFDNGDYTNNSFIMSQIDALETSDIEETIDSMEEYLDDTQVTVWVYYGTGKGGYDAMLDDKESGDLMCEYVIEAGMPCYKFYVKNAVHAQYWRTKSEFLETTQKAAQLVNPVVEEKRSEFLETRYNAHVLDSLMADDYAPR